jgi:xanthine/CO dehydrogenase XdhC/CoxF family maturation factor
LTNERLDAHRIFPLAEPGELVKHWHETAAILDRLLRLAAQGSRATLATVVRIDGSAYRRPGAKFLVEESGASLGGVSGGCLEADVQGIAAEVLRTGEPRLLRYETGSAAETAWGLGLGCEGAVDIFVQVADAQSGSRWRELLSSRTPFAVCTAIDGPKAGRSISLSRAGPAGTTGDPELDAGMARSAAALLEHGTTGLDRAAGAMLFTEVLRPPPQLTVFGAGDDARPLAALAAQAGFLVTVVDHRPAFLTSERFPGPARLVLRRPSDGIEGLGLGLRQFAVVQMHALVHDRDWLSALLPLPLSYLGLLGPRRRKEEILRQLDAAGSDKLFAPVGLDLGADGPEQVAISIVAEMLAVLAGHAPVHLRDARGGIHGP